MNPAPAHPRVVGLGEILWDLLPGGKQLGGAPANFAYHARVLGAVAAVASSVGSEALGTEVLERLNALGVGRKCVTVDPRHPTGTVAVELDAAGVPQYVIYPDVAWDFIPTTPALLELARGCDVVCFGTLGQRSPVSRSSVAAFLGATRADCLRVFDINLRQSYYSAGVIDASLRRSTILKLNDRELPVVSELLGFSTDEAEAVGQLMSRYALRAVALTRGGAGSRLYTENGSYDHAGCPAEVVDTVGAGDAFTAALSLGWLRGEAPERILDRANRLASFVCSRAGATPEVPARLLG